MAAPCYMPMYHQRASKLSDFIPKLQGYIYIQKNGLVYDIQNVLKTSQLSLTRGPWTQRLQNIFQSDK